MACNSGVVYFIPVPFVHLHSISILRILLELLCRTRTPRRIVQLETFFSCKSIDDVKARSVLGGDY
jgi:hypothetical protein